MASKSKDEIERMVEDQAKGKKVPAKADSPGKGGKLDKRRSKRIAR